MAASSVRLADGAVVTDADDGRVDVAVAAVVVLGSVHAVRAQYVVRALGLAVVGWCGGYIGPGAGAAGPAAAADGSAGAVAAAGPILVLAPCGLGLIPPINFVVQIFVFAKIQARNERVRDGVQVGERKGEGLPRTAWSTYFAIFGQIDFQCLRIVLETQRGHGE